ncbi:MAG: hypothetical protein KBE16_04305 [Alphaproteobacteria bacterium]|nr:hypothetical protein [Alphaproteobacteria bacterium]MBP9878269.1 hypothetical protein [Alphaproteobacteria bacterium]
MSFLKASQTITKALPTFTQTTQFRFVHHAKPRLFHELTKPTTFLIQRSVSLRPFSTKPENEQKESSAPDVSTTLLGTLGGLGYIYVTQSIISYFFEQ